MKKIGILFDLDGTLLDSLGDLTDSVNYTLQHYNLPTRTIEEIRRFVGNGARNLIKLACDDQGDVDEMLAFYQSYYKTHCRIKTAPYAHIPEVLECLSGKYPLAVVSNKPDAATKSLCADFFPGIAARGEASDCARKPAPDMVMRAMELLGAERCVYVGDSEVDVLTAQNAGVPCLSVLWGFRDRDTLMEAGATHFCEDPKDLVKKLKEMM